MLKLEADVLAAIERGEAVNARAVQLLLRRYQTGALSAPRNSEAIGQALAASLQSSWDEQSVSARAPWVEVFVDAAAFSDDDRLVVAIRDLTDALRESWTASSLAERCAALGSCLYAARLEPFQSIAADAIDELERVIGRAYEPGEPLGSRADQVSAASALLVAYSLSGRLPYPMLAEELMHAPRTDHDDFTTTCEAARVLCRLAALHDDEQYRAAAVLAPGADYRRDAALLLDECEDAALRLGADGAIYALARLELESQPQSGPESESEIPNPQSEI